MVRHPAFSINICKIIINGGTITLEAKGDAIESNGSLEVNGGTIYVIGPTSGGDGALDYQIDAQCNGAPSSSSARPAWPRSFPSWLFSVPTDHLKGLRAIAREHGMFFDKILGRIMERSNAMIHT